MMLMKSEQRNGAEESSAPATIASSAPTSSIFAGLSFPEVPRSIIVIDHQKRSMSSEQLLAGDEERETAALLGDHSVDRIIVSSEERRTHNKAHAPQQSDQDKESTALLSDTVNGRTELSNSEELTFKTVQNPMTALISSPESPSLTVDPEKLTNNLVPSHISVVKEETRATPQLSETTTKFEAFSINLVQERSQSAKAADLSVLYSTSVPGHIATTTYPVLPNITPVEGNSLGNNVRSTAVTVDDRSTNRDALLVNELLAENSRLAEEVKHLRRLVASQHQHPAVQTMDREHGATSVSHADIAQSSMNEPQATGVAIE